MSFPKRMHVKLDPGSVSQSLDSTRSRVVVAAALGFVSAAIACGTACGQVISGGVYHSLALRSNGTVAAWGNNYDGQVSGASAVSNATAISGGLYHSLALRSNGTVAAWGYNAQGQVSGASAVSNATAISGGGYHNLALRSNGTVAAWGDNGYGQVSGAAALTDVVAIQSGTYHSIAVNSDGTIVTWGRSNEGQTNVPSGIALPTTARWSASGDGDYLNAHRWSQQIPSTALSDAVFDASGTSNVNFGNDARAKSLQVDAGNVAFNLNGNSYFTENGGSVANGSTLTLNNGTFTQSATGQLNSNSGGTVQYTRGTTISGGSLTGAGLHQVVTTGTGNAVFQDINLVAGSTLQLDTDFVESRGTVVLGSGAGAGNGTISGSGTLQNSGTIRGVGRIYSVLTNDGTGRVAADINGGLLTVSGSTKTNSGGAIMSASNGGTLSFNNVTIENAGGFLTSNSGSTVEYYGTINGGTLNGTGTHSVRVDSTFDGITFAGQNLTVEASRALTFKGNSSLLSGSTVTLSDAASQLITTNNANLSLAGTVTGAGTITNNGGASLYGSGTITTGGLTNNGTLVAKDAMLTVNPGSGVTYVNNGIMRSDTSTLRIQGGTISGAGDIDALSTVEYSGTTISGANLKGAGTHSVIGNSTFTGTTVDNTNFGLSAQAQFSGTNTFNDTNIVQLNGATAAQSMLLNTGTMNLKNDTRFQGTGTFTNASTGQVLGQGSLLNSVVTNNGLIRQTTAGGFNFGSGVVNNNGTIETINGSMSGNGTTFNQSSTGTMVAASGTSIIYTGTTY